MVACTQLFASTYQTLYGRNHPKLYRIAVAKAPGKGRSHSELFYFKESITDTASVYSINL